MHFSLAVSGRTWEFTRAGDVVRVALGARLDANSSLALKAAAIAGAGIARIPAFAVADALASGELETVLPDWDMPGLDVHALMPARRYVPAKARAFVEFLVEAWRATPDWRRPSTGATRHD